MASVIQNNFRVRKNFGEDQQDHRHPEPHRHPEAVATRSSCRRTSRRDSARTSACRASSRASSRSRTSTGPASLEFVSYNLEKPKYDVDECRQRGMTFAAPIKVDRSSLIVWDTNEETGVAVDPRHQGAGGLLRRDPADDRERHVHHQRHRARRRHPAAPQPGRLLRSRQGQDALVGQAALQRAHHPVPRLVARLRVRPEGHHLRPHRPPPQDARDGAAARARLHDRGAAQLLLRRPRRSSSSRARSTRSRSSTTCSPASAPRATSRPGPSEVLVKKNRKFTSARSRSSRRRSSTACRSSSTSSSARSRAHDVVDEETGEVLLECNEEVTEAKLDELRERGIDEFKVLFIDGLNVGSYLRDTLSPTRSRRPKRRSWRSTAACARAIRRRSRRRRRCSTTCSSTPSATTCRRSAASS